MSLGSLPRNIISLSNMRRFLYFVLIVSYKSNVKYYLIIVLGLKWIKDMKARAMMQKLLPLCICSGLCGRFCLFGGGVLNAWSAVTHRNSSNMGNISLWTRRRMSWFLSSYSAWSLQWCGFVYWLEGVSEDIWEQVNGIPIPTRVLAVNVVPSSWWGKWLWFGKDFLVGGSSGLFCSFPTGKAFA